MNIERLTEILREAAKAEIMPRFRRLDAGTIETKAHAYDLVTEADKGAESFITAAIGKASPHMVVIGEEAVAAQAELLEQDFSEDTVIYIDPVDGTWNFAAGLPLFAVMAAVVQRGEIVAGVIYDPVGDDWIMTEKGCGCFHVFPDGRMNRQAFAKPVPIGEMAGMASTGYLPTDVRASVNANLAKVQFAFSYRCAGHEFRLAAGGNAHFLMYNKLTPWDHSAGSLMIQESGGHIARFDGTPFAPHHRSGGLLAAPDRESWQELRQQVFTV